MSTMALLIKIDPTSNDINEDKMLVGSDPLWVKCNDVSEEELTQDISQENTFLRYESQDNDKKEKHMWTDEATIALITFVESHYEELFNVNKKKNIWTLVSDNLIDQGFYFSVKECSKKWDNLIRTYKRAKALLHKTGRRPTKFRYFERLDNLLHHAPSNVSPHSIDVAAIVSDSSSSQSEEKQIMPQECSESTTIPSVKRKISSMDHVSIKKKYYEEKGQMIAETILTQNKYLEQSLQLKRERNELLKEKIKLEERRVFALEKLAGMWK